MGSFRCDRGLVLAALAVLSWVFFGAVVYYLVGNCSTVTRLSETGAEVQVDICPWHFAHAFYYSVQTGLSIGFGVLSETQKLSELYSIFHILAGSSVISGALGFFVSMAVTQQRHFLSQSEHRLIKASLALQVDGYHGLTLPQARELMLAHPQYVNAIIRKLYPSSREAAEHISNFARADPLVRKALANELLKRATQAVDFFKHDSLSLEDLVAVDQEHSGRIQKARRFLRHNATFIRLLAAFVAWIAIGAIFSAVTAGNDLIRSVYFAIAACSTAGIVPTRTVRSDANVGFVGVFCLVGVPLYAACLGSFANILVQKTLARQTEDKLNENLTEAEAAYLRHLGDIDGHGEVTVAEYTELHLLRLGVVDREMLQAIRAQFQKLDVAGHGKLKIEAVAHQHHLETLGKLDEDIEQEGAQETKSDDSYPAERSFAALV